jgi:hypothetical protein
MKKIFNTIKRIIIPGSVFVPSDYDTDYEMERESKSVRIGNPIKRFFVIHRVDAAGKYAGVPRPQYIKTIITWLIIIAIIVFACMIVTSPETTGWYGSHFGQ